jgi:hypothetical protein
MVLVKCAVKLFCDSLYKGDDGHMRPSLPSETSIESFVTYWTDICFGNLCTCTVYT